MPMPSTPTASAPTARAPNARVPNVRVRPRLTSVAAPVLAGLCALASLPAQAQVFLRPYGGVYVERYYEPPPAYYPPPPAYYEPPPAYYPPPSNYRAPGRFPAADIGPLLRSMGMTGIGRARVDGPTYMVDATARSGARMRVRIDAYNGQVIAMHPIGQASAATPRTPSTRQALPAIAPLPPARPPELAAIPAPEPSAEALGAAAPAASSPDISPPEASPAESETGEAPTSAASTPADGTDESAPAAPEATGAVRIIPGTAVPPSAMPTPGSGADASAAEPPAAPPPAAAATESSGTGTGVGTGSTTPAGTASVYARGAPAKPEPAEE
ncbi:hypothetical protein EV667_4411 [Ancylobacter aquaticus]|uniref:PepSY domain-containing protein n=1 Tax=Ancylobacter aquaticus TaxID=100 RepID=A0A4R1H4M5_ANCAQ|nr:hypothetical protein [Ancylobacter aquaticus]TCK16637.1 hypothetical protein EV667_4411 [Ancylobacter aquaticus]